MEAAIAVFHKSLLLTQIYVTEEPLWLSNGVYIFLIGTFWICSLADTITIICIKLLLFQLSNSNTVFCYNHCFKH
jgi:hypothetical protein